MMELMHHLNYLARRIVGEIPRYLIIKEYDVSVKKILQEI